MTELLEDLGHSDCNIGPGQWHHGVLSKAGGRTLPYNPPCFLPNRATGHIQGLDTEVFLKPSSLPTVPSGLGHGTLYVHNHTHAVHTTACF